jgi:hypothetical protein
MPGEIKSLEEASQDLLLGQLIQAVNDLKAKNEEDHEEIKAILKDHEECLEIFKFSKCKVMPWMGRNKWVIGVIFCSLSIWISSLDWLNRWLQWAFFPPISGGP